MAEVCINTKNIEQSTFDFILELLSKVIEYTDVERKVLMPMGELFFKRAMYRSKETGEYVYPIDVVIGLNKRDGITAELSARLIQGAASESYEKSNQPKRQSNRNKYIVKSVWKSKSDNLIA